MNDTQKIYHELEMLQELGLLEKGTNICEITTQKLQELQDSEIQTNESTQELENHMVLPTPNNE
jgi:hypothetical protein